MKVDAHGRQHSVTDARNGAAVYGYNNADLAMTVTTPSPGTGVAPVSRVSALGAVNK
jgi:hypothetical protein